MEESEKGENRRDFFRKSVTLAGAAPAVLASQMSSLGRFGQSEIRCGMIGTGRRGKILLLRGVTQVAGVRVVAVCDIRPAALQEAEEIVSGHHPTHYSYYKDMLDKEDLDAVFVVTPPYLHKQMIVEVLRSGRHCYTEKPIALTVNEIERVRREAARAKGILQAGQQLRYRSQFREAMPMIREGVIGNIGFVRGQRYQRWDGKRDSGELRWWHSIEEAGDQVLETSVHELDVINWIMDDHPIQAAGLGGQNMDLGPEGNQWMDHYGLSFEYPGNRHAIFSICYYSAAGFGDTFIHVYGSKGCFDLNYSGSAKIVTRGKVAPPSLKAEDVDMTSASVADFLRCIKEGEKPFCNVEIAATAALTALLGRKAIYEKRTVTWQQLLEEGAPLKRRGPYLDG